MVELKSPVQRGLEEVDELVHEPRRFALLNILAGRLDSADYTYLKGHTGMTSGNPTRHLAKLEQAGLVEISKEFVLRRPKTRIGITEEGQAAVDRHWRHLQKLREDSRRSEDTD